MWRNRTAATAQPSDPEFDQSRAACSETRPDLEDTIFGICTIGSWTSFPRRTTLSHISRMQLAILAIRINVSYLRRIVSAAGRIQCECFRLSAMCFVSQWMTARVVSLLRTENKDNYRAIIYSAATLRRYIRKGWHFCQTFKSESRLWIECDKGICWCLKLVRSWISKW